MKLFSRLVQRYSGDPEIDRLLDANRARYLQDMDTPDWKRIRIIGTQRWEEIRKAQERLSK